MAAIRRDTRDLPNRQLARARLEESTKYTKYRRHAAQTGGLEQMEPQRRPILGTSANAHVQLLGYKLSITWDKQGEQRDITVLAKI